MPRSSKSIQLTQRDHELLHVLGRGPHWTDQLLTLSQRFPDPFPSTRYLQKRLLALHDAKLQCASVIRQV